MIDTRTAALIAAIMQDLFTAGVKHPLRSTSTDCVPTTCSEPMRELACANEQAQSESIL